ncbi:large ribosomal subunit protein mL52 [Phaenicophaeus curvirostris]|uniref:large ribosomal subunit protein mL52 n=1 Tax=Phaenicophaeus curvirostris TaxID=33595 RepID=UPI0037F0B72A
MAARKALRRAELQARALRPPPPRAQRLGEWRVEQGLAPSSSGYGPLRDRPDWSFVDGRAAPLWKGQLRRLRENQELALRAVSLLGALEAAAARGGVAGGSPRPRLRPKGSQYAPVRTSTDQ